MDPLDLVTRIIGLFVPVLDWILRRRKGKKQGHIRVEVELPEGQEMAAQLDLHLSFRISGKSPGDLEPGLELLRSGKFKEALGELEKAEARGVKDAHLLNLKSIALYRLRRYRESLDAAKSAHRLKAREPAILVNIANALRKLGRRRQAISWYRRAIAMNSAYLPAWFGLADVCREMGRPARALKSYDKAIEIDSSRSDLWNNRSLALIDLAEYSLAEESLKRAIGIWPDHAHALGNLAKLVAGLRRYQDSIDYAEHALKLDSNHITAWHSKAFSLSKLERHREAAEAFREVLKRRPGDAAALGHLGSLEVTLGDYEEAETHLKAALAAGYDRGRLYVDLASLRFRQNRFREGAKLTARALLHRQPDWARSIAYANMAFAFAKYRRFPQAAASARRAISFNPQNADAWNNLAACLLEMGDFKGSEESIDRAIILEPRNESFGKNKEELLKAKVQANPVRIALSQKD